MFSMYEARTKNEEKKWEAGAGEATRMREG
jgi:hypothetical protein